MRNLGRPGTFWPTAEQELLIDAALGDAGRARAAWEVLRSSFYVDGLDEGSYPLLPLLYRRRDELGLADPLLARLKGIYRHTWSRNQVFFDDLLSVLQVLREGAIEPVVTGAAAAALCYYPEAGLRPVGEVAISVSPEAASQTSEVLRRVGWDRRRAETSSLWFGHESFRNVRGVTCFVWTRAGAATSRPSDPTDSLEITVRNVTIRVSAPTDQLSQTVALGARGHRLRNIQWLVDAMMILRRAGADIEWERLLREAQEDRAAMPMREALTYLQSRFGITVPNEPKSEIAALSISRRDALAYAVGGFGGHVLGEFPGALADYIRCTADERPIRAMAQLPRRIQRAWELDHIAEVPVVLIAKALGQYRVSARPDRPDEAPPAAGSRRSAKSR